MHATQNRHEFTNVDDESVIRVSIAEYSHVPCSVKYIAILYIATQESCMKEYGIN
jgi:hypothetical protein